MVKKTTSTKKGKDTTKDKGFGVVTYGWHDKRKALRQFCRVVKKEIYPVLGPLFAVGQFASYNWETLLDVITYLAVNGVTSESGSKGFNVEYKKDNPSPRMIRERLEKLKFSKVMNAFQEVNKNILNFVKKKRKFRIPVLLSIDITYKHFYGKRKKYACTMDRDRGTNYGYKYASAVISVAGIRFTIHTVPMTQFTEKTEILEKLIKEARKYVKIKAVLIDREFSNSPCIEKLEELSVTYITPVVKHRKKFLQSLKPPCKADMPLGSGHVPIVAVRDPDDLEETLYYCTNMDISSECLEEVIKAYHKRWTVENAFKSQKLEFLGKTYSIDFAIRFFFWMYATLLYNVWILGSLIARMELGLDPAEQERSFTTAFLFGITMKIVFVSPLFDGGECEELLRLVVALVNHYLLENFSSEEIPQFMMNA